MTSRTGRTGRQAGDAPPRLHVFAGKGGVGKTTCAAATALAAAERGRRVGLISTDPAHSLGDALGRPLASTPRQVPTRNGSLDGVELDADRALARWLARRRPTLRTIAERGTYLDEEDLERVLRLSFPGVDELMALVELTRLADRHGWEQVVVDTAPTGHTLRMLDMPATLRRVAAALDGLHAKHRFLADSLGAGHRAGAADRLIDELDADGRRLTALLRDSRRCRFTWVMLPERLSLEETRDGVAALAASGIVVNELIVNRLTPATGDACHLCAGRRREETRVVARTRRAFPGLPMLGLSACDAEPRGVAALRPLGRRLMRIADGGTRPAHGPAAGMETDPGRAPLSATAVDRDRLWPQRSRGGQAALDAALQSSAEADWLERLAPEGVRLLAFAGKGGVGKTTCTAAAALALAGRRPDARVLALSVDPAHSLGDVLGVALGDAESPVPGAPTNLRARELDADAALARTRERYRRAVEETFDSLLRGSRFDVAYDREALHGLMDLAPPGLDEVFAVLSVVEALLERRPPCDVVVLDTAPTGHALRLLAMPATALAWVHALLAILLKYREIVGLGEVAAELVATARRLRDLSALLGDAARARVVAVTRAAELPCRETERLLARLKGLRLAVPAVIVNALTSGSCGRCRRARRAERHFVATLGGRSPRRPWSIICAPGVTPPPRGVTALDGWAKTWNPGP
jgi:arsenite/tail-anchored protein-transporting ATPase